MIEIAFDSSPNEESAELFRNILQNNFA